MAWLGRLTLLLSYGARRPQDFAKKLTKDHVVRNAIPMFVNLAGDDHVCANKRTKAR